MVLSSIDGEIVYKSDNVLVDHSETYSFTQDRQVNVEMKLTACNMKIETAETPPEMPKATVAAQATKIIKEEQRKIDVEKQWKYLTEIVCHAIKCGKEYAATSVIFDENKLRLIEMGYEVEKNRLGDWEIRWAAGF